MTESSIPVDLFNPGQVFACMGLMEAADILLGGAEGGFDWNDPADVQFKIRANGNKNPIETILNFLTKAKVYSIAPPESQLSTETWKVDTKMLSGDTFPFPVPNTPATLPAVLEVESAGDYKTNQIVVSYWGENQKKTSIDNVKFWAGAGGYPGVALAKDALDLIRDMSSEYLQNPFELSKPQSSSFRFDWRRDYIDVHIGFSLNNHSKLKPMGFPIVEILAAIGLTNARPKYISKLKYCYGVASVLSNDSLLDICLMRAALGGSEARLPLKQRIFYMDLDWPGKEGQARCITNVIEC